MLGKHLVSISIHEVRQRTHVLEAAYLQDLGRKSQVFLGLHDELAACLTVAVPLLLTKWHKQTLRAQTVSRFGYSSNQNILLCLVPGAEGPSALLLPSGTLYPLHMLMPAVAEVPRTPHI